MRYAVAAFSVLSLAVSAAAQSAPASAQSAPATAHAGRQIEFDAGLLWTGGFVLGSRAALETPNGSGSSYALFSTETDLAHSAGGEFRIAVELMRRLDGEGFVTYARPQLRISASADAEGAAPVVASETVEQVSIGGGISIPFRPRGAGRVVPFAAFGVAYLRELHSGLTVEASGQTYSGGGGVKWALGPQRATSRRTLGLRTEARLVARTKGVAFDDGAKVVPQITASFFVRF